MDTTLKAILLSAIIIPFLGGGVGIVWWIVKRYLTSLENKPPLKKEETPKPIDMSATGEFLITEIQKIGDKVDEWPDKMDAKLEQRVHVKECENKQIQLEQAQKIFKLEQDKEITKKLDNTIINFQAMLEETVTETVAKAMKR